MKLYRVLISYFLFWFLLSNTINAIASIRDTNSSAYIDSALASIRATYSRKPIDTQLIANLLAVSEQINYQEANTELAYFKSIHLLRNLRNEEVLALLEPHIERKGSQKLDSLKVFCCIKVSQAGIGMGNYFLSIKYLEKAEMLNASSESAKLAIAMQNAHIWMVLAERQQTRSFQKVLQYCLAGEQIARSMDNKHNLGVTLVNAGMAYAKMKQFDASNLKFEEAIKLADQNDMPFIKQQALLGFAELYFEKKEFQSAYTALNQAEAIVQTRAPNEYLEIKLWKIATLIQLKDFQKALGLTKNISTESAEHDIRLNLYKSEAFAGIGNYKNSLACYKKYIVLKDSIAGSTLQQELNYLDYKYKIVEKDKRILESKLLLDKNTSIIKKQRTLLLGSIFGLAIITLSALVVYLYFSNKQKLKYKEAELQRTQSYLEGELNERKRIAMDLHDSLGGHISCIRLNFELAKLENFQNPDVTSKLYNLIVDASKSVRDIAHNLNSSEFERLDIALALTSFCNDISGKSNLNIEVTVDKDIVLSKFASIEILTLAKELIHNIVKHAHASIAKVLLFKKKEQIYLQVKDNGKGFVAESNTNNGIGLHNVKQRVDRLGGSFEIKSDQALGTEVTIII